MKTMLTADKWHPADPIIENIYIGHYIAVDFADSLRDADLLHVLKLYEGDPYLPSDFQTLELVMEDGVAIPPDLLSQALAYLRGCVAARQPVLVTCGAGVSRSPLVVMAYLIENGYSMRDAFHLVRRAHPTTNPHLVTWRDLIRHYGLNDTLRDMLNWLKEED